MSGEVRLGVAVEPGSDHVLGCCGDRLSDEERARLERMVRSPRSEQRMVTRPRVVLIAADRTPDRQSASQVDLSERKGEVWRNQFVQRLESLCDRLWLGEPQVYDHDERLVVFRTARAEPSAAETHWTGGSLADAIGMTRARRTRSSPWPI